MTPTPETPHAPVPRRSARRRGQLLLLLLAPLLLTGCDKEEIQTYKVPRSAESDEPAPKVRLLGALITRQDSAWAFKLAGPEEKVAPVADTFKALVESVRFPEAEGAPTWTVPEGWKQEKGGAEFRIATLKQEKGTLEISVSQLSARGGALVPNVNRWRKNDLGLGPIGPGALKRYTTELQVDGVPATLVDMTGPGPRRPRLPFTYKVPEGWRETGPRTGMVQVLASFEVRAQKQKAEVTIVPLTGPTGGMLDNYNRWRKQVGLEPLNAAQFADVRLPSVKVGEQEGTLVDLTGPAGDTQQRLLLVLLSRGKQTWYFKMFGDADLVGKQKGTFESFLQSVKFTGAADE